jgi:stage III sporulation protein AD
MDIIKISAIGIITAVCVVILREHKSEAALMVGVAGGAIILLSVIEYFTNIFGVIGGIAEKAGIPDSLLSTIFKIIGIGYIADFSAGIVEDAGQKSLGEKIVLGGKLMIMVLSLPIITLLFETIAGILP